MLKSQIYIEAISDGEYMMLWGSMRCLGQNILAFQQNRKTSFSETAAESKETLIFILLYVGVNIEINKLLVQRLKI